MVLKETGSDTLPSRLKISVDLWRSGIPHGLVIDGFIEGTLDRDAPGNKNG